ncbi:hypothetical protein [Alkalinema sp. FACHB-956]|uniref:hypothetical protein n=1 Tax=Alkalinema sp. FACHB-956 TaxID=2692768 RepID=UPI001685314D|nr:hypothetical protein [Alkalinema sp. FACHB-956]MBD2329519.1 hypothetical protein [Alkalinema sp. FACHB-956]
MMTPQPLTGITLIDCARSNAVFGLEVAALRCGYGDNIEAFQTALQQACDTAGITGSALT